MLTSLLLVFAASAADPADTLQHQGRLIDSVGEPIHGEVAMTFAIYNDEAGTTPAWTSTRSLSLSDGYYSVALGEVVDLPGSLFNDRSLWLAIEIDDNELLPRQPLTGGGGSVGYGGASGYPRDPQLAMGFQPVNSDSYAWIEYPFRFSQVPITIATIDETHDRSGPVWIRQNILREDRLGIRGDNGLQGLHYMALSPGVHELDGKKVIAGRVGSNINGGTVTFPEAFTSPPIVLVMPTVPDNSGAVSTRVIFNPTATSFQYYCNENGDQMDWIALEPGEYTVGRYHFYAGSFADPDNGDTFSLPNVFDRAPNIVLTIRDTNNSGASYTRVNGLTSSEVTIYVNDNGSEVLNYVAFEDLGQ